MEINPLELKGNWSNGWALDMHTTSSVPCGQNEFGHVIFYTTRSEMGEALYKLKYRSDQSQVGVIAKTVENFIRGQPELADIIAILAVPPSDEAREFQPVTLLSNAIGKLLGILSPSDYIQKIKETTPLKNIDDKITRHKELEGAFMVKDKRFKDKHVILFDDLFDYGETLESISTVLKTHGKIGKLSVLAVTKTRSTS